MNETLAVVFIRRFLPPYYSVIAYEQADIDYYRNDYEYIEVGKVIYDTEKHKIIRLYQEVRS